LSLSIRGTKQYRLIVRRGETLTATLRRHIIDLKLSKFDN